VAEQARADAGRGREPLTCASSTDRPLDYADANASWSSPLTARHEVSHPFVVLEREVHAISSGLPVRRAHVVKRMSAVVALSTIKPEKGKDLLYRYRNKSNQQTTKSRLIDG